MWRGALMFSLICTWINDWVNNRETGDLRRHRTHYDIKVMFVWGLHTRSRCQGQWQVITPTEPVGGNYWSLSLIYLLRACAKRCWRHFGVGIPQGNLKECRQRIQNILANFNGIYSTGHPGIILLSSDRANQPNQFGTYVLETFTAKIEKKTFLTQKIALCMLMVKQRLQ